MIQIDMEMPENRFCHKGGKEMKCPNCGAPLITARCEYCGTIDYERMRMVVFKQAKAEAEYYAEQVKRLRAYGLITLHNGEEVTVI